MDLILILSLVLSATLTLDYVDSVRQVSPLEDEARVVQTGVGPIRGIRPEDGEYTMYLGIPYGKVDESNIFGPALPYPPFDETFDADDDSRQCPQVNMQGNTQVGSLDCLRLNIYVPDTFNLGNSTNVMIWIHGGAFSVGSASRSTFGPSYLIRHGIILVTINYRLGPYGFMCLDIPEVAGNQGLKDQLMAIRWVHENIAAFGGNPDWVTLAGNSAGAMSVDLHTHFTELFPTPRLFHAIILQSGVALVNSVIKESDPTSPLKLAEYLNYTPNDVKDALSFLATVDPAQLIRASNSIGLDFKPCVEKVMENAQNYITVHPLHKVPTRLYSTLIGFNNDESLVDVTRIDDETFEATDLVDISLKENFDFEGRHEHYDKMKKIVTNFYVGDDNITVEMRRPITDMTSDFKFNHPILRTVEKYFFHDIYARIFMYLFSYSGGRNLGKQRLNITSGGAAHTDELGYLFDVSSMEKPLDPEDQLILDRMTRMWANFVLYGFPTPYTTDLVPVRWSRVDREKMNYLDINTELSTPTRPFHDRSAFLDLFYSTNEQFQNGFHSAGRRIVLDISLLLLLFVIKYIM